MENSARTSTIPGHYALGVVELHGTRIIIGGIYGESANDDPASLAILKSLNATIEELKYLYQTTVIILSGDFNVVYRPEDTTSFHDRKPRTAEELINIIEQHNLKDIGTAAGNDGHTWYRTKNNQQSSRLDLILTSMEADNLKFNNTHTIFDHTNVSAHFNPVPRKTKHGQKDFILGSEEYIYRVIEKTDDILQREKQRIQDRIAYDNNHRALPDRVREAQPEDTLEQRHGLPSESPNTPELVLVNDIIYHASKIHDHMIKNHNHRNKLEVQTFGHSLKQACAAIKRGTSEQEKRVAQQQYDDLQRDLKNKIEAKNVASQERISNFYKTNLGKILPVTFQPIKEHRPNRDIHHLNTADGQLSNREEIVQAMQRWYEETAQQSTEQTTTLEEFLNDYNINLPQINQDQQDELIEEITLDEVKWALAASKEISAPGPTGQGISLYRLLFQLIPEALTKAINQIAFVPGILKLPELSWIQERKVVWIPKIKAPETPSDYRPLSMLEVLYKIPSRILARRLSQILPDIISRNQHGFIQGKGIQEPSVTVTHLIQEAEKTGKPLQLASFDIEKAFDRVGHLAITQSLTQFGIPTIFVETIHSLSLNGKFQVEVNGTLGDQKTIKTGSGQGDPLSSVLFNIATEPLNRAIALKTTHLSYKTIEGRSTGPIIYADDNINPLSLTTGEQITEIIRIYNDFKQVSGLNINIAKTSVLCINTGNEIVRSLQEIGLSTPDDLKHLGIRLCKTMIGTVTATIQNIDTKAAQRRILATTPPTDMLHRATLLNVAYMPLYNHVFMALPIPMEEENRIQQDIQKFMWTKTRDGIQLQKRRMISKKRLNASHAMGGLNIPLVQDTVQGLHANLLQKILKNGLKDEGNMLYLLLQDLLQRTNRPSLPEHVQRIGPTGWTKTAAKISPFNKLLAQAFQAVATLLVSLEDSKQHWHLSAIIGHSETNNLNITETEKNVLKNNEVVTVSQLFQVNDSGMLSRIYDPNMNNVLRNYPMLNYKLRKLANAISSKRNPTNTHIRSDKTNATYIFPLKNLSQTFKKIKRGETDDEIRQAPAYLTRIRDGVYIPDPKTFEDAYMITDSQFIPSKTRELAFQVLNRTLWTSNKAFKSGLKDNPNCKFCGEVETQEHLLYQCEHYSEQIWNKLGRVITTAIADQQTEYIPRIEFTPANITFNKIHPTIQIHVKEKKSREALILLVQETKREIYFRNQNTPHPEPVPVNQVRIIAHLMAVTRKIIKLLEYQNININTGGIQMIKRIHENLERIINPES